jgi:hypothetical protein
VQNVVLAIRLARHTADDWDNAAIPDDIVELSELLNLSLAATLKFVRELWDNPMGTDGFEFVEYAAPDPGAGRAVRASPTSTT